MWLQPVLLVQRLAVQKPAKITVVVTSHHVTSHSDQKWCTSKLTIQKRNTFLPFWRGGGVSKSPTPQQSKSGGSVWVFIYHMLWQLITEHSPPSVAFLLKDCNTAMHDNMLEFRAKKPLILFFLWPFTGAGIQHKGLRRLNSFQFRRNVYWHCEYERIFGNRLLGFPEVLLFMDKEPVRMYLRSHDQWAAFFIFGSLIDWMLKTSDCIFLVWD